MMRLSGHWLLPILLLVSLSAAAQQKNGFDLSNALIPVDQILSGGPPRDGIPSIDQPRFEPAAEARLWRSDDIVMSYDVAGTSYAYPIGILNWHEIVNHRFDSGRVLITFCPLCGTGIGFDPTVAGRDLTFGVSGLLYNSDLLMYDHQTESLWSQLEGRAVSGPLAGTRLVPVPVRHERWQSWRERVGDQGRVLSTDTGHTRNYRRSPYGDYDHSERIYFPVSHSSRLFHPKTWVLGWQHNGEARAWPFPELAEAGAEVEDEIGGLAVVIHYDDSVPSAVLTTTEGEPLAAIRAFWFAWYTFHPETTVFSAP
ncbi:DUF3179 domain-containing protein [Marinobacter mobilis]|uniref:DUF3179 domain-containing protein n=1 Tax=Marinobacter mobilis TaxID=488533 RepID=UPI0035C73C1A